ncbi:hypothetical protein ACMD2_26975 [Ananas comosus]|uniref:Uncharacterized protein n=1 Tax=Ananas comosus TaxID=4615 RepID=A0A199V824_ANACO|nr:hypothetical protein ACMD2_26975 [Ananas comosus]
MGNNAFAVWMVMVVVGWAARGVVVRATLDPVDFLALQAIGSRWRTCGSGSSAGGLHGGPVRVPGGVLRRGAGGGAGPGGPAGGLAGADGAARPGGVRRLSALAELSLVPGRVAGPSRLPRLCPTSLPRPLKNLLSGPSGLPRLPRRLRTLDLASTSSPARSAPSPPRFRSSPISSSATTSSRPRPAFPDSAPLLRSTSAQLLSAPSRPAARLQYLSLARTGCPAGWTLSCPGSPASTTSTSA